MLMSFEGWQFKLEIRDRSEEGLKRWASTASGWSGSPGTRGPGWQRLRELAADREALG
jgi:hypothetical protein